MALACRIVRALDGSIDYIKTEEGTRSALFDSLVGIANKQVAYDLYSLTETEEFKNIYPGRREPSVQEVLSFANRRNSELSTQQAIDTQNTAIASGLNTSGQVLNKLKQIFLKKGVVVFDRGSMLRSGFYNSYEIETILSSKEAQQNIKNAINSLSNSDNEDIPDYNTLFVVSQTSKLNSLGKQVVENPYIVENQIAEQIAGTDIGTSIESIPFDNVKNSYYSSPTAKVMLAKIATNNRLVGEKEIVNGELANKSSNRTFEILSEVMDLQNRGTISEKVMFVLDIPASVWQNSPDAVYTLLKDVNNAAVDSGVDFLNLEDNVYTKDREEILNLLQAYEQVLNEPTNESLETFSQEYSTFFDILDEPANKLVPTTRSSDVYLESEASEYELFNQNGLIKRAENIYTPVEVMENVDEVYSTMAANKALLPEGVTTEAQLRDYVEQQMSEMEVPDFNVDADQLQKMILYKMYFQAPNIQPIVPNNTEKFLQFTGDYTYLTEEYPSDFYKQWIKEKKKNSDLFRNFYSNFKISNKGIELVSKDPITIQNVMRYTSEELKQYNLLSKNLGLPVEEQEQERVDFNEMIYNRQQAVSNPNSVPKLRGDYSILSPITIAVKNENSTFVRTPAGVFEIDYMIGNISFYNILPKGDSRYNSFGLYKTKTQSDLNLDDYTFLQDKPDYFTRAQNYYTQSELNKINEKYFRCL